MSTPSSLGRSILRWVVIFFLAQAALLAGAWAIYAVPWARIVTPLAVSAAYHALLAAALSCGGGAISGSRAPTSRLPGSTRRT